MYSTALILISGITAIVFMVYLFFVEEQKKQTSHKNKYWTVKDDDGRIYFVKNLQMNVVNNYIEQQKAVPIYLEGSLNGNYSNANQYNIDSVIN